MDFSTRLLLLLEVTELGSFTNVAEQKNVDRSVISKQISRLEKELGVKEIYLKLEGQNPSGHKHALCR